MKKKYGILYWTGAPGVGAFINKDRRSPEEIAEFKPAVLVISSVDPIVRTSTIFGMERIYNFESASSNDIVRFLKEMQKRGIPILCDEKTKDELKKFGISCKIVSPEDVLIRSKLVVGFVLDKRMMFSSIEG